MMRRTAGIGLGIRLAMAGVALAGMATLLTATAGASCAVPANSIEAENCLPGSPPSQWDISGAGDPSIQGFATDISVDQGQPVFFKIDTSATDFRLDIYRLGYYGGLGARQVAIVQPSVSLPQTQPNCLSDPATGLVDCGNWDVSASWTVPANAVSGIYIAKLVHEDPEDGRASHIVFVVRDDDGGSDLLFQTNDTTWQAYNTYGGNSLYTGSPAGRAYKVSYNRPFTTRCCHFPGGAVESWLFSAPYPMVRWLEASGYDVSYFTGIDADRLGSEILEHRAFLSVGHDEYWSAGQRTSVEAARAAGIHLAFFSGNEMFWKTRWEPSLDGSATPYRTLVSYKETHANAKIDPLPNVWTGTWRDPRFSPPADGGRPENAVTGTIFTVNGISNNALAVPTDDGKLRFWRNTSVATLGSGQTATFAAGTLGFEWDEDLDNGFRPAGAMRLSSVTVSGVPVLQDFGSTYASGTATHHLMLYRHASGALVFGAGTVQWSWGLDATHDAGSVATPAADVRMRQATVNLLADMGAQPATLQAGLVAATASTDFTAPSSAIAFPTPGASFEIGSAITVTGTATDAGGGVVGAVEVSIDGGATWVAADGRASWSYSWQVSGPVGAVTLMVRAVDDSGNLESMPASVTVDVDPQTCPCSVWNDTVVPGQESSTDTQAVELGVKIRADSDGLITGLRFYKGSLNTGTHIGNLWTTGGVLLASVTFTGETASGWQEQALAAPVNVTAGTTYIASYYTAVGRYAFDQSYFASTGVDSPPLRALQDGVDGSNGVFQYGPTSAFPTQTFNASNYWVDVVFTTDDVDGDGFPTPADCDDSDDTVFPGALELCDGKDNDCDLQSDEDFPTLDNACSAGIGECISTGSIVCTGDGLGTECDAVVGVPVAELCDGLDNDCDGSNDETFSDLGTVCTAGIGECQTAGVRVCAAGGAGTECDALPSTPVAEICDGLDNDCDGALDETFGDLGSACSVGVGECVASGTRICAAGGAGTVCDAVPGTPTAEICDGLDNDCDTQIDEGTGGGSCTSGQPGACAAGTEQCMSGALLCQPNTPPTSETCNGIDDDCDGTIDEGTGGGSCTTGQPGACGPGTFACVSGVLQCQPDSGSTIETCDGLDNDCDGNTDEGNPQGGATCSTGQGECPSGTTLCQSGALVCDPNGQGCDDGDACTQTDTCNGAGQCIGGNPRTCPGATDCAGPSTCNSATGGCDAGTPVAAATLCTPDQNICTDDECDGAGSCRHVLDETNDPSCVSATTTTITSTTSSTNTTSTMSTVTTVTTMSTTTTLPPGACMPVPRESCFESERVSFQIKRNVAPAKNQMKWKWTRGAATEQADTGDPVTTTTYALCVYDATPSGDALAVRVEITPNAAWQDKAPKGWKYKDKTGVFEGVQTMQLKTGADQRSKAQLKGRGDALPMPAPATAAKMFHEDPRVVVQLINSEGRCWTSRFVAPARENTNETYKAKTP